MGLHLIAMTFSTSLLINILEVAAGLGFVIFVHELGHFAVAKMCGVKCEKFYLGFDIYGLKLAKFRYGETEYGIGILPLGGYVKMLGQDDNPAKAAEELERSKLHRDEALAHGQPVPAEDQYVLDPRSYMAQSVPKRMAIISAGVIMNVIFAFLMAMMAFRMGVQDVACVIGSTVPGEAAWQADLRPGDHIIQIGDLPNVSGEKLRFNDLMMSVALGDNVENGVKLLIERPGQKEPFWVTVRPNAAPTKDRLAPMIGAGSSRSMTLDKNTPSDKNMPAGRTKQFEGGDTIVAVNGEPTLEWGAYNRIMAQHPGDKLTFSVLRKAKNDKQPDDREKVEIEVDPNPAKQLGLVMKLGKITAVRDHSPAAEIGLQPGDFIEKIDGEAPVDPMLLPDWLRERAGKTITLSISRKRATGQNELLEKQATLQPVEWYEQSAGEGWPMSAPALGIAYEVGNTVVRQPDADSPAGTAEVMKDGKPTGERIKDGDEVVKAEFLLPELSGEDKLAKPDPIEFSDEKANWPAFIAAIQQSPPGTRVKLTLSKDRSVTLEPVAASDAFVPIRGLRLSELQTLRKADSLSEAAVMAWGETRDALSQVYLFLRKIVTRQVSPKGLGGPLTIFQAAGAAADRGFPELLIFLTMLSANLAVINFLPIPLLDGGHMAFLAIEGIFRRPVSERVVVAFHYAGFVFLITLMLFVLGLDVGLIPRHG